MPVEVTDEELRDALAMTSEWDVEAGASARSALEWMGWNGAGPFYLRHYDVQMFVWYILPRKFLTDLEFKRQVAAALARVLDQLGGRAATYAATCRASDTDALLEAWENEDPDAWDQFRTLLEASGLEPPDTESVAWGGIMGLDEASARDQIVTALEQAAESGVFSPSTRSFRRRQAEITEAALLQPLEGGKGESRIEAIHLERLENWLQRGIGRGSPERRQILEPVLDLLAGAPPPLEPEATRLATAPALWLLELGIDGIALTQTGAINRALVREAAARWAGWWNSEIHGPPHQEADLTLLGELHHQLKKIRLLRRSGRRLITTNHGRKLICEPAALLQTLAHDLIAGEDFRSACTELTVALLLTGFEANWSEPLAKVVQPAIVADGWHSGTDAPDIRTISWTISDFIRAASAAGLIAAQHDLLSRKPLALTPAGRSALTSALRNRALAPRSTPY